MGLTALGRLTALAGLTAGPVGVGIRLRAVPGQLCGDAAAARVYRRGSALSLDESQRMADSQVESAQLRSARIRSLTGDANQARLGWRLDGRCGCGAARGTAVRRCGCAAAR